MRPLQLTACEVGVILPSHTPSSALTPIPDTATHTHTCAAYCQQLQQEGDDVHPAPLPALGQSLFEEMITEQTVHVHLHHQQQEHRGTRQLYLHSLHQLGWASLLGPSQQGELGVLGIHVPPVWKQ